MPKTTPDPVDEPAPDELDDNAIELDAIEPTTEASACAHPTWLRYVRPVITAGEFYNVRCRDCGQRAWRG